MIKVNFNASAGLVRAINGVNRGPTDRHYAADYTGHFRKARIASVRTHDCNRGMMDVVDLHYIFPNPNADPEDEANYYFTLTDNYLKSIRNAGCGIYFRLGESIEGRGMMPKHYVVAGRWKPEVLARVCLNIARHYNEGWANGFEWDVEHWQFWNEPGNGWPKPPEERPCWTGTVAEFYDLYRAVSTAFKQHNPAWKIGLAGYGRPDFVFPSGHPLYHEKNPWRHLDDLLNAGPFDSISWHQYGASWEDLVSSAQMVRACLDAHGLSHVENHITEWNYMPYIVDDRGRYCWFDARTAGDVDRLATISELMNGVKGAAYVFGALARLQDAPIDLTHLYTGAFGGALGLFDQYGVPFKKFAGLELFASFLDYNRVEVCGGIRDSITALAVLDNGKWQIGVAHLNEAAKEVEIRADGGDLVVEGARQYLDSGWRDVETSVLRDGDGCVIRFPLGGDGMTHLTGTILQSR